MISTSSIFSTGEKKWMPMNCSGRWLALASPVIGRVEVLEAKMQSPGMIFSTFPVISALTLGSSNTASMIRSQPFKRSRSGVAVMRSSIAAFCSAVVLPRFMPLSR